MAQATIPFDESEMTLEASNVYVLAAAQDILHRMQVQVVDPKRYPEEFIDGLEDSLTLLTFLVQQAIPQLIRK